MSHRRIPTEQRSADLATDFGLATAIRWFGQEAIDSLPRRQAGKNKGKPVGVLCWRVSLAAGWTHEAGVVAAQTVLRAWIGRGPLSSDSDALPGRWMGRVQSLCGSRDLLSQAARDRHAAEQARDRAELEAYLAAKGA